jgi:hypothetical protein
LQTEFLVNDDEALVNVGLFDLPPGQRVVGEPALDADCRQQTKTYQHLYELAELGESGTKAPGYCRARLEPDNQLFCQTKTHIVPARRLGHPHVPM